jgi:SPP1 gp7 family putative phage head morphogenesis protein
LNKFQKEVIQHQLDAEKEVLEQLTKQYQRALNDIDLKIRILQSDELTQSRVYRIEYQKALKLQVEGILEKLHSDEFTTIQQFLSQSYTDGFIGSVYDMHGQGVPLILPIDNNAAVKAVVTDSKISEGLYNALGVDTKKLKQSIRSEITRGIASGMPHSEIARNIAAYARAPLGRAKTIVRTEAHRIAQASALDAQKAAVSKGAKVVKQWMATLDGETRRNHRRLDGQIREVDEPFEMDGMKPMYPGDFGDPAEDCNCRCQLLQRAKLALDKDELKALRERAVRHSLYVDDPSAFRAEKLPPLKNFEEFKKSYLKAAENVNLPLEKSVKSGKIEVGSVLDNFDRKIRVTEFTEDLVKTNPNYESKEYKWINNCQRCVPTYEMRRRGLKVTAKPIPTTVEKDYLANNFALAWENQERVWCMKGSGLEQIKAQMAAWGDGARAEVSVVWKDDKGHVFVAEQRNGTTVFLDPQSGNDDCSQYFDIAKKGRTSILRIDNNSPSDAILDCCENGGG